MKRISYISILILIWLSCGARSCTDDNSMQEPGEEKILTTSRDSIKQAFEVYSPSDLLLRVYEATAKQKLTDFADYLKIATDSSLDKTFRQQAVEMAKKLFISREVSMRSWSKAYPGDDLNTLEKLLNRSLLKGMSCWVKPVRIDVNTQLTRRNDTTFVGTLSFYEICIPFDKPDLQESLPGIYLIDIYALKKEKSFGKETLRIWEVYLGDIKQE